MIKPATALTGKFITDFHVFAENQMLNPNSPYDSMELEETRDYGDGKNAGAITIILLTLNLAAELLKELFVDYIKSTVGTKKHSASYTMTNEAGEQLTVTLNNLTMDEIKKMIYEFKGNITTITSENDDAF